MTEDSGFAYAPPTPEPAPAPEPEPAPEPTPAPVPEEEAAPAPAPAEPVPAPSVPDNQPQWLKDVVAGFHGRLAAVEKALVEAGIALAESEL